MKKIKNYLKFVVPPMMVFIFGLFLVNLFTQNTEIKIPPINNLERIITYRENTTSYNTPDGIHHIYWAQGVKPPIMTTDKNLLGKKGYFDLESINGFNTYMAEFNPGNGYYDYNKNLATRPDEHPLCYLGTASNLISWWLDQNDNYVKEYLKRLQAGNIYGQPKDLYPILPYNEKMWREILQNPVLENQSGYLGEMIGKSPLSSKYLKPYYYKKHEGYFSDLVLDFFFNGYDAIPSLDFVNENNENNYVKDPRGGFFFPIFGKTRIVKRLTGSNATNYNLISKNLRNYFAKGYGVSFSYLVNSDLAHAITVWGAEYDSSGKLVRVFITDSDDFQPVKNGDKYWRGLVGFNVVPDTNGVLTLTNNTNYNPNRPGNYLTSITLVSLAKDIWEEKLADTEAPVSPKITNQSKDAVLALGANRTLKVEATKSDNGFLEYIWYESNNKNELGTQISHGSKNYLTLNAKKTGTKYYTCIIKNYKNGKSADVKSKTIKVDIQNIKTENADTPVLTFNYATVAYYQNDIVKPFKVIATIKDTGTLTYQWYQSINSYATNGKKIEGATSPEFYPSTKNITTGLYYYCVVTNTNDSVSGNSVSKATTKFAKRIIVKEKKIIDAAYPVIDENITNHTVNQNESLTLKVNAHSVDGGLIKYEWYELINNDLVKLNNNTNILKPNTKNIGTRKYQLKITNYNKLATNNKENFIFSNMVTVTVKGKILSSDNELKNLIIENAALTPKFNKNINNYSVILPHQETSLKLKTTIAPTSKVSITNPKLNIGETKEVIIKVTAENGKTNIYKIKVTRKKEHQYSKWEVVKKPSCTMDGLEKRTCLVDGHTEYRKIDALGHDYEEEWTFEKLPTTTTEGIKYHKCKICGAKKDITKVPPLKNHEECEFGNWQVIKKPTCTKPGMEMRVCKICGKKEYREIKPTGHVFETEWTFDKMPTDKEGGIKSHHCKYCDAKKDITKVPPLNNHEVCEWGDWVIVKEPTYEETGLRRKTCKICGKIYEEIIPKLTKPIEENQDVDKKPLTNKNIYYLDISLVLFIAFVTSSILIYKNKKNKSRG